MSGETKQFTCTMCPIGCPLELEFDGEEIREVQGHQCNRGAKYAEQEFSDPRRSFSTTVAIEGGIYPRLPVKLTAPVPKARILEAAEAIHRVRVKAPVALGQVILAGLLGDPEVDVVACRPMKRLGGTRR